MSYIRLTLAQSAAIADGYRDLLALSRTRRAKHLIERDFRAALRELHWSDSAVGELVAAHWALEARGSL